MEQQSDSLRLSVALIAMLLLGGCASVTEPTASVTQECDTPPLHVTDVIIDNGAIEDEHTAEEREALARALTEAARGALQASAVQGDPASHELRIRVNRLEPVSPTWNVVSTVFLIVVLDRAAIEWQGEVIETNDNAILYRQEHAATSSIFDFSNAFGRWDFATSTIADWSRSLPCRLNAEPNLASARSSADERYQP